MAVGFVAGDQVLLLFVHMALQEKTLINHAADFLADEFDGLPHAAGQLIQGNIGPLAQGFQVDLKSAHLAQRADSADQETNTANQGSTAQIDGNGHIGSGGAHQFQNSGDQSHGKTGYGRETTEYGFEDSFCGFPIGASVKSGQILLFRGGILGSCVGRVCFPDGAGAADSIAYSLTAGVDGVVDGPANVAAQFLVVLGVNRLVDDFLDTPAQVLPFLIGVIVCHSIPPKHSICIIAFPAEKNKRHSKNAPIFLKKPPTCPVGGEEKRLFGPGTAVNEAG